MPRRIAVNTVRLEALEVIPYSLRFREPYVTARGRLTERELILVRLRGEGLEALGETTALTLRGGSSLAQIARDLRQNCWPALAEAELDPGRIWAALARCRNHGARRQALAAVDIALHDLAAKATGRPLWSLLGASASRSITCNATLPVANPTGLRAVAEGWAADGFETFKLKVGTPGDVAQVATVRAAVGPRALIRLDANGVWGVDQAAERLRALARHTIELVEEPVGGLQQMARLSARTRIRLAADESVVTPHDARHAIELGACQLATVKLAKVGGISAALRLAEEISIYLSSALEGPVGIAAAAHAAQALPAGGPAHGLATQRLFADEIGSGARLDGDKLLVGDEPGLGVTLDEDALRARRLG
jgi:L-alanine-DL-glutamate epimerase-like enolase superfamily enzyme